MLFQYGNPDVTVAALQEPHLAALDFAGRASVRFNKAPASSCKDFAARSAVGAADARGCSAAFRRGCLTLQQPALAAGFAPRVQPARADIRPASPCGILANRPPSPQECSVRESNRCSARG